MRFFNTAGPVNCEKHYCLPPLARFDLDGILSLIDQEKYFVLHAPRQTGKTSCLLALMDYLNREGKYRCLYINVEMGQSAREDVRRGIQAILSELGLMAQSVLKDGFPEKIREDVLESSGPDAALNRALTLWAEQSQEPLVLLVDEIDALVGDTLISVLRQLRAGYSKRPASFPQTIVLCGVRDVRDYRIHSSQGKDPITGGSAFNVKAESLRLGNFDQDQVETLYRQHTQETGQVFEGTVLDQVWKLTAGQPWLVNALGYELCFKMKEGRERSVPITADMVVEAKERLISRRETHLDQLVDKLREERVRGVIEPILAGQLRPSLLPEDDVQYVYDLGLVSKRGELRIANKIYQEVIPRALTYTTQLTISHQPAWYVTPDGRLDLPKLLAAFQDFFRQHSEHWVERFDYKGAGPQLLMQAFLQRIVNSGGRIEREYGLGRMRTDLSVWWPWGEQQVQRAVIELKILYGSLERTIKEGLGQTWDYMDRCEAEEGHLIVFDRDPDKAWESKIFKREASHKGTPITVWGM
jgi:hypothetical protein